MQNNELKSNNWVSFAILLIVIMFVLGAWKTECQAQPTPVWQVLSAGTVAAKVDTNGGLYVDGQVVQWADMDNLPSEQLWTVLDSSGNVVAAIYQNTTTSKFDLALKGKLRQQDIPPNVGSNYRYHVVGGTQVAALEKGGINDGDLVLKGTLIGGELTPQPIYVDKDVVASGNGLSWATAKKTIAEGLTIASTNDQIWVADGTYPENITMVANVRVYGGFVGNETLRSQRDPSLNVVIIDGGNPVPYTTAVVTAANNSVLDGFTVKGGHATDGGGLYAHTVSNLAVANCIFTSNISKTNGGGLWLVDCPSVTLSNCEISDNTAEENNGGGIISYQSTTTVTGCTIQGNSAPLGYGGGIAHEHAAVGNYKLTLSSSKILDNDCKLGGAGLLFGKGSSSPGDSWVDVDECIFRGNKTTGTGNLGGAICAKYFSNTFTSSFTNCIVVGNEADASASAIWLAESDALELIHCTVTGNKSISPAADPGVIQLASADITIKNTICWNEGSSVEVLETGDTNASITYSCIRNQPDVPNNVIDEDPMFIQPWVTDSADLRLKFSSPCIDAANPTSPVTKDIDGVTRPQPVAGTCDQGATECMARRYYVDTVDGSASNGGLSWMDSIDTISGVLALSTFVPGSEVWVTGGTYTENLTIDECVQIYGGFQGSETLRSDRVLGLRRTTIDGGLQDRVFRIQADGVTLDGLTIINGYADETVGSLQNGGGVFLESVSNITISNCVIKDNKTEHGNGGGIYCHTGTYLDVSDCTIKDNEAETDGGGIFLETASNVEVHRSVFRGNDAVNNFGGAICVAASTLSLNNSLVAQNSANVIDAGGIYVNLTGSELTLANCTITENTSLGSADDLLTAVGTTTTITNSIIWGTVGINGTLSADYTCSNQTAITGDPPANNNIDSDPLFYRPGSDWHLRPDSPCINAGNETYLDASDTDLEGNPRVSEFKGSYDGSSATVDIGCYEWPNPEFFGLHSHLAIGGDVRAFPSFPDNVTTKILGYPETLPTDLEVIKDTETKIVRIELSWEKIQPIRPEDDPIATGGAGGWLWEADGSPNSMFDRVSTDWTDYTASAFSEHICPTCPVWGGDGINSSRDFYEINLGYLKEYFRMYAGYLDDLIYGLHEDGYEIYAIVVGAPVWEAQLDYGDHFYEQNWSQFDDDDDERLLQELMSASIWAYRKELKDDPDDLCQEFQGWREFITVIEERYPFINNYEPMKEVQPFREGDGSCQDDPLDPNDDLDCEVKLRKFWQLVKATKEALDEVAPGENEVMVDVVMNSDPEVSYLNSTKFLENLIDFAGEGAASSGEKLDIFKSIVDVISVHLHMFNDDDSIMDLSPRRYANIQIENLNEILDWVYPSSGRYPLKELPVDIGEVAVVRGQAGDRMGAVRNRGPLFNQFARARDMIWQQDATYESLRTLLAHPHVRHVPWWIDYDSTERVIPNYIDGDSGMMMYHFTEENKVDTMTDSAPASWVHPISGESGNDVYDYYWSDKVVRFPAYYAYKAIADGLPNPNVPVIESIETNGGNPVDTQRNLLVIKTTGSDYDIKVNLLDSLPTGTHTVRLLIDGTALKEITGSGSELIFNDFNFTSGVGGDLDEGETDTLETPSWYHRLSLEFDLSSNFMSTYYDVGWTTIDSTFVFIGVDDDDTVNPVTPAPTATPGGTDPTPTPNFDENDYVLLAEWDFDGANAFDDWTAHEFYADGTTTPVPGSLMPTPGSGGNSDVQFKGANANPTCTYPNGDPSLCSCCEDDDPRYGGPAPCNTPNPSYTPNCDYSDDGCYPDCQVGEWEGAEMYLKEPFVTTGYKNLIVEYQIKTEGLEDDPHGWKPPGMLFSHGFVYHPYHVCGNVNTSVDCVQAFNLEEVLQICYTTTDALPVPTPNQFNANERLRDIRKWRVAEAVPRKVLKEYSGTGKYRRMNFSMHDIIDYEGQLNLWFRTQINSDDDKIILDNIRILGQEVPPEGLPPIITHTPSPTWTQGGADPTATPNLWGCTPTFTPSE